MLLDAFFGDLVREIGCVGVDRYRIVMIRFQNFVRLVFKDDACAVFLFTIREKLPFAA